MSRQKEWRPTCFQEGIDLCFGDYSPGVETCEFCEWADDCANGVEPCDFCDYRAECKGGQEDEYP